MDSRRTFLGQALVGMTLTGTTFAATSSNIDTARRFFELLNQKDVERWAQLWADDGRILVPYPPEGFPTAIAGKDKILSGFRELFGKFETFEAQISDVYPASDSDAVCVEYLVKALLKTGVPYTNSNIAVFRFHDGKIVAYHDYFDPRRFQTVVDAGTYLTAAGRGTVEKVRFASSDSFVVGNLYRPPAYSASGRYPALVIGGSLTAVKEQMGGIYALELAQRGFLTLAIDYRNYGESGGRLRQYEDPEAKAQDLVSAVHWLEARADVAPGQIGVLGICTSGGTALYAAARDSGIKAVACVASHFAEPAITPTLYGGKEGVEQRRLAARTARAHYEKTGENRMILAYSNVDPACSHPGPNEYYMDQKRGGGIAQWQNALAVMSWDPWLDFDPVSQASNVMAPTLIVHTDQCALPDQARKVHRLLAGPKKLHWTTGPHFEFYDGTHKVREAADAIAAHFHESLAGVSTGA